MKRTVRIRLLGQLKTAAGTDAVFLTIREDEKLPVSEVLAKLSSFLGPVTRAAMFGHDGLADPRERIIILKNDRDVGVLNRLETPVADGDELTLIPIAHGG